MYSLFRRFSCAFVVASACFCAIAQAAPIRVCADPGNLPFSNRRQQGFENRIAELLARDMHTQLVYVWQRMGRGFVREYLNNSRCDVLIGVPVNYSQVDPTRPYYRSTYVFVSRLRAQLRPASLNDPKLHSLRIGVQILDDDYATPAHALARRGMQRNIVGFESTGNQASSIVRAVAVGQVDTAIVWGPLAGYFAERYRGLTLTPVQTEVDPPGLPFTYAISMGVRKGNTCLRDRLQEFLDRHATEIQRIIHIYGVPQVQSEPPARSAN